MTAIPQKCSVPCTQTNFYVNRVGFDKKVDEQGLVVIFDQFVEKTISELQIGPKTLLTRIGGVIGVGKNLLWLLIFLLTSLGGGLTLIKKKLNKEPSSPSSLSSPAYGDIMSKGRVQ